MNPDAPAENVPVSVVERLVRFSREVSATHDPAEIMPLLAACAASTVGADASAVLLVSAAGEVKLVAARGLPESLGAFSVEFETVDAELGDALREAAGPAFRRSYTIPLASTGELYGALVLLVAGDAEVPAEELRLAEGIADLAATAVGKAFQFAELERSYAELRASREALLQNEKLRALGQMAAGVSHDLKNILNPLSLQVQLMKRRLPRDPAAAAEVVSQIEDVVRHGLSTVERLRAFSRQQPERNLVGAGPVDLDRLVEEAVELCRPRLRMAKHDIALHLEMGTPPALPVDAADLVNSIVNLIVNAVDAMPGGGAITVRTGHDGIAAWVEVADTGCGIPEDLQRRIFEPFFTTKGPEKGTGMGLTVVQTIVRACGGRIRRAGSHDRGAAHPRRDPGGHA